MTALQHIVDCPEHENCTAIYLDGDDAPLSPWVLVNDQDELILDEAGNPIPALVDENGDVVQVHWVSHMNSKIHPAHRINPDVPAVDVNADPVDPDQPCPACIARPDTPWSAEV